ncbi:ABC transporter permease subunit [Nocardia otitidiscaviarum]|uniref:ABC transporter permease subunit n=1 Tax=Nocardia otitidiscaviarum TaxID=1823 RepID=UPI0004A7289B|nr:ABC transporter permease subunit [Nocardia otitidiscaviarum]MBF6135126.1 ABC transporter permease subunit [Nocardia otitidiscaviarum]MBF6486948.1 ABC transporter permease subunit [Nocardia otitidiscaviarum]
MTRSVFTQTLKEQRRGLIGWSIALFAVPMIYVPSYSTFKEQGALDIEGGGFYDALGMGDFGTATGYLESTMFALMGPLLLLIFVITFATRTAAQEDSGTLDLLLAQPIGRANLLLQRCAALAAQTAVVVTVFGLAVLAGAASADMGIPAGNILAAVAGLGLLTLTVGAITLLAGAATGHRGTALAVAALVAVLGYLANNLGGMIDGAQWLRRLSPFYYAGGDSPLVNGWNIGYLAVLAVLVAIAVGLSLAAFDRRDLAV